MWQWVLSGVAVSVHGALTSAGGGDSVVVVGGGGGDVPLAGDGAGAAAPHSVAVFVAAFTLAP